ncbi:hypothetical protein EJ04DRAFT_453329, partial [Polyplosphaeria fusca]
EQLAAELVVTAINLLNHTPSRKLGWKVPFELVHNRKPPVSHFELIGTKAYTLNKHLARGDKLAPHTLLGRLVG